MSVVVITKPSAVLTLEEAKRHLRVDGSDDDGYIGSLIAAAQMSIDGPDGWLGRAVGLQTIEYRIDGLCDAFLLPFPPAVAVVSVSYRDDAGGVHVVPAETYELTGNVLGTAPGFSWPSGSRYREGVKVRYRAGYFRIDGEGEDAAEVNDAPAPIKQALLLLIGQWYSFRENVSTDKPGELPFAVEALLSPYRVWG